MPKKKPIKKSKPKKPAMPKAKRRIKRKPNPDVVTKKPPGIKDFRPRPKRKDKSEVELWLDAHPKIANSIKWQFTFEDSAYDVPETAKRTWPSWSAQEKAQLVSAFKAASAWLESQSGTISPSGEGLAYPPVNIRDTQEDNGYPYTSVDTAYAWDLFLCWIALELATEIGGRFPWSVATYGDDQLQVLFDSAAIMSRHAGSDGFTLATGNPAHPNYKKRKDNLGTSLIAPPRSTYAFLANAGIIGTSRMNTLGNLLQWISEHCTHFYGNFTYQVTEDHWQYRGNPPITRIIEGTTNPTLSKTQFGHWTAGCHGTTGFIRNALRAVNIPVHISTVCGHSQACFTTDAVYLDHGDNPYNSTFKSTGQPATALLIDKPTYVAWFGASTDNREEGCDKIGHQTKVLAGEA